MKKILVLMLVVVVSLMVVSVSMAQETDDVSEIAFAAQIWDGRDWVVTCDQDGQCDYQSEGQNPEFSPNGEWLGYNTWLSTEEPMVMAKSLTTSEVITITPGIQPTFCEDGETIIYSGYIGIGSAKTLYKISVDLETGSVTSPIELIAEAGNEQHPNCGDGVVFYEKPGLGGRHSEIWQLNLSTLEKEKVDIPVYGGVGVPSLTRWSEQTQILYDWNYNNYGFYVSGKYNLETQENMIVAGDPEQWSYETFQPNCGWNTELCLTTRLRQFDGDSDIVLALNAEGDVWEVTDARHIKYGEFRHISPHPDFRSAPPAPVYQAFMPLVNHSFVSPPTSR